AAFRAARQRVQTFAEAHIGLDRKGGRAFAYPFRVVELALTAAQLLLARREHGLHARDFALAYREPRLERTKLRLSLRKLVLVLLLASALVFGDCLLARREARLHRAQLCLALRKLLPLPLLQPLTVGRRRF